MVLQKDQGDGTMAKTPRPYQGKGGLLSDYLCKTRGKRVVGLETGSPCIRNGEKTFPKVTNGASLLPSLLEFKGVGAWGGPGGGNALLVGNEEQQEGPK